MCEQLGLRPVPSTQVLARDAHAELLYACAAVGSSIEAFALEVRHLQRTEVSEVQEPFAAGAQKGSSAMPHKRNPWRSEQLCGLARVLRGNLGAGMENVALWHERDMSHSSVERIVLTDSLVLAYYMAVRFRAIVEGLDVHADRMLENLGSSYGFVFSETVLLALVESGLARDEAYRIVQRAATRAWEERRPFRAVLARRPRRARAAHTRTPRCVLRPATTRSRTPPARSTRCEPKPLGVMSHVALPHHYTGKVRELYEVDHDRMLVVASDRISVFDVVLDDPVPDKGRVLTALSTFWFEQHRAPRAEPPRVGRPDRLPRDGRARRRGPGHAREGGAPDPPRMRRPRVPLRRRLGRLPRHRHRSRDEPLPAGLRQAERLPEPMFTPTTKAEAGHDLPVSDAEAAALVGDDVFEQLRDLTLAHLRVRGRSTPSSRG